MTTLGEIKQDVLTLCESPDVTEIGNVAKIGIQETLKYISSKIIFAELAKTKTLEFSLDDHSEGIPLNVGGFEADDYDTPLRLYINGIPYRFRDYLTYTDLTSEVISGKHNRELYDNRVIDKRPKYCWTLRYEDQMILFNARPDDGADMKLVYKKKIPVYDENTVVFLPSMFESLLTNGAVLYCKEYIREPEMIINPYQLLSGLDTQIQELQIHLETDAPRQQMTIGDSYSLGN